jgi:hypothetical protein
MSKRDIEQIINTLAEQFPAIQSEQLKVKHPGADDDGLWFFMHPDSPHEVQLESSSGMCPFLFESTEHGQAYEAATIQAAVSFVAAGLGLVSSAT